MTVPNTLLNSIDEYIIPGSVSDASPLGVISESRISELINQGARGPFVRDLNNPRSIYEPVPCIPLDVSGRRDLAPIGSSITGRVRYVPVQWTRLYCDTYIPMLPYDPDDPLNVTGITVGAPIRSHRCNANTLSDLYPSIFPDIPSSVDILNVIRQINPQFNLNDVITRSLEWRQALNRRMNSEDPVFHTLLNSLLDGSLNYVNIHRRDNSLVLQLQWGRGHSMMTMTRRIARLLADISPDRFMLEYGDQQRRPGVSYIVIPSSSVNLQRYASDLIIDLHQSMAEMIKYRL
uniref:Uncharacterized protein n=1 Tax=viral metagenome TaxID=1070528 RepID=A0A6C0BKF5_9ZZZZ